MSFAFLIAGFVATTNAGRVAAAREHAEPGPRAAAAAVIAGAALVLAAVLLGDDLLDALEITPESFRIAAGLVLGAMGVRTLVWPTPGPAPFAAVLVTPELACAALSFGADEAAGRVLGAAAITVPLVVFAATARVPVPAARLAQFLAALQIVVAVAMAISGMREV